MMADEIENSLLGIPCSKKFQLDKRVDWHRKAIKNKIRTEHFSAEVILKVKFSLNETKIECQANWD